MHFDEHAMLGEVINDNTNNDRIRNISHLLHVD